MSGGRSDARKGRRVEQELVRLLIECGLVCVRVPLSGAAGGNFRGDIHLTGANGFCNLYDWLNGVDVLIVCADRSEPLAVLLLIFAAQIAAIRKRTSRNSCTSRKTRRKSRQSKMCELKEYNRVNKSSNKPDCCTA